MSLDSSNVLIGKTGAVSVAPVGTTAPTGTADALSGHTDLGYIGEDGVTRTMPGAADSEAIKAWQNGATVRTVRTPSDENPSYSFVLLETKKEVIEFALNVTVTQTATEGSYEFDVQAVRDNVDLVLDVIDGSELVRNHVPKAIVTEIGDTVFSNGEAIGYEVTVEAERDDTLGYNFKEWSTRTKSAA